MKGGFVKFATGLLQSIGMVSVALDFMNREGDAYERLPSSTPLPYIYGVGWADDQGRRPEMEDEMLVIQRVRGLKDCWILGVYDGHGGKQTADAVKRRLSENFLSCLQKKSIRRWEEYRIRAMARFRVLDDFLRSVDTSYGSFTCIPSHVLSDYESTLRLQKILECIINHNLPSFLSGNEGEEGCTTSMAKGSMSFRGEAPHYLSICPKIDIEAAAREAFVQTDYEILQEEGITNSGATACFCVMNPTIDIERLLNMPPGDLKEEDWGVFFSGPCGVDGGGQKKMKNNIIGGKRQSSLVHTNLTVAHVGDTRAVLVFDDAHALRLTSLTDHKASDIREVSRIERLGGFVFDERVNGCLAIGRALGDWRLKVAGDELAAVAAGRQKSRDASGMPRLCPAESWKQSQREYVVSHIPHVCSVNLSEYLSRNSEDNLGERGERRGAVTTQRVPVALVLGCDGLFDVCSDSCVGQLCTEFINSLSEAHPDMTPGEAGSLTARLLVDEAIQYRRSHDNVSVQVALLDPFNFALPPPPHHHVKTPSTQSPLSTLPSTPAFTPGLSPPFTTPPLTPRASTFPSTSIPSFPPLCQQVLHPYPCHQPFTRRVKPKAEQNGGRTCGRGGEAGGGWGSELAAKIQVTFQNLFAY
ncbi:protein phosphatase 2c domain-containing [Cystoisospora suis]|uniref:Protein phosphatase 2c domain-containing n=1 Tax=Cystoisospora suis TaxID=483139 RepID=A0A2C6L0M6_9APIC|nr:protein phosphatase 2c domain-containing [Cystoisospora suis]